MILFITTIDDIIDKINSKYDIIAYADDILISANPEINPEDIINEVGELLEKIGLELNLDKCCSTNK